ncbi:MAG: hypothetical protein R3Y54_11070 [Eubacteriales bacterium]
MAKEVLDDDFRFEEFQVEEYIDKFKQEEIVVKKGDEQVEIFVDLVSIGRSDLLLEPPVILPDFALTVMRAQFAALQLELGKFQTEELEYKMKLMIELAQEDNHKLVTNLSIEIQEYMDKYVKCVEWMYECLNETIAEME